MVSAPGDAGSWVDAAAAGYPVGPPGPGAIESLCERINEMFRTEPDQAARAAIAALYWSRCTGDRRAEAFAVRAGAILDWNAGRYPEALSRFEEAVAVFEELGDDLESARTRNSAIQTLIYLSRYEQALEWAARARDAFERHGQRQRINRLDGNVANLLYRQDRFEEAIAIYDRIEHEFIRTGEPRDVASVLRNKGVCLISLSRFDEALEVFRRAREYAISAGMVQLVAEADYNIAYLYFLRGDYIVARSLYQGARAAAQTAGDRYHAGLCDLDEAEMLIELNLVGEGHRAARAAARAFRQLGLGYELAKAKVFMALCAGEQGRFSVALSGLANARRRLEVEQNSIWPALIDLYAALLLVRIGHTRQARRQCRAALGFFSPTVLPGKAVLCRLLLGRIALEEKRLLAARTHATAAARLLHYAQSPALDGHTWYLMARIREAGGDFDGAHADYQRAQERFENLRDRIRAEEMSISFFRDKVEVYECHFRLLVREARTAKAFEVAERAKSGTLFRAAIPLPVREEDPGRELAARRAAIERRLESARINGRPESAERLRAVRAVVPPDGPPAPPLFSPAPPSLDHVRAALRPDDCLVEYFSAQDQLYALTMTASRVKWRQIGPLSRVAASVRYLHFHLSRSRLPGVGAGAAAEDVNRHLRELYDLLVRPILSGLTGRHCILVPHGPLHCLPFHALLDGRRHFGEQHSLSVMPSSALMFRTRAARAAAGRPLVIGVADRSAPEITREARFVAGILPRARLLLNDEATVSRFRECAASAPILHLAAHGRFRHDNPWFSSIQLGDQPLSLFDLYSMSVPADLAVLSGCSTGLGAVVEGDELVGLVRGLLRAGVRSALLSLWPVNDAVTTRLMDVFYREAVSGRMLGEALQAAQSQVRAEFEHPFFWAPFTLVGGTQEKITVSLFSESWDSPSQSGRVHNT